MADRSINMALEWRGVGGGLAIWCGGHGNRLSRGRMRGSCEAHCSLYLFFTQLIESLSGSSQVISRLLRIAAWLLTMVVTESVS
jgi:hypothetical protein